MKAVRTPKSNFVYRGGPGSAIGDLPVERRVTGWVIKDPVRGPRQVPNADPVRVASGKGTGEMIEITPTPTVVSSSTWVMDDDDTFAIMRSRAVLLTVLGEPMPPMQIQVIGSSFPKDGMPRPPVTRMHLERAIRKLCERLVELGADPAPPEHVIAGLEECLIETADPEENYEDLHSGQDSGVGESEEGPSSL